MPHQVFLRLSIRTLVLDKAGSGHWAQTYSRNRNEFVWFGLIVTKVRSVSKRDEKACVSLSEAAEPGEAGTCQSVGVQRQDEANSEFYLPVTCFPLIIAQQYLKKVI